MSRDGHFSRHEARDSQIPGMSKSERIDLGLALMSAHALPGVAYTCDEIAMWCGCSDAAIHQLLSAA